MNCPFCNQPLRSGEEKEQFPVYKTVVVKEGVRKSYQKSGSRKKITGDQYSGYIVEDLPAEYEDYWEGREEKQEFDHYGTITYHYTGCDTCGYKIYYSYGGAICIDKGPRVSLTDLFAKFFTLGEEKCIYWEVYGSSARYETVSELPSDSDNYHKVVDYRSIITGSPFLPAGINYYYAGEWPKDKDSSARKYIPDELVPKKKIFTKKRLIIAGIIAAAIVLIPIIISIFL